MFRFFRERFKGKPLAEWMDILEEHDIEFGPVNSSMEHFLDDAHFKAREMILDITAPDTGEKQHEPGFGMKFAGTPPNCATNHRSWERTQTPYSPSWAIRRRSRQS